MALRGSFATVRIVGRKKALKRIIALVLMMALCRGLVPAIGEAPVEVELWHYYDSSNDKDMIEALVGEYNALQDDIHITATYLSRQELMNRYNIGAISGQLPDIGMVDSPDMAAFISLGVFMDITDALEDWDELQNFYPGPLMACMDPDRRLYGLPHNSSCLCLAVNTDLLSAAGYDHMPASRDELLAMAAAATDPGAGVYGMAMSCIGTEEGTFQLLPWLCPGEGVNVDDLTDPSAVEGLTALDTLVRQGYMNRECVGWNQSDAWYAFCEGRAAMVECGTWHLSMTDQIDGAFNYDFCLLPTGGPGASTSVIGGENYGICAGCADVEGCVAFLEWLCSAENQAAWAVGAGKIPTRMDCEVAYPYEQKGFAVFQEEMQYAQARGPHAEWPTISAAINDACQAVFVDEEEPATALAKAMAIIGPIVENNPLP